MSTPFEFQDIEGFLYDFDGTLVDSFRPIRQSFNHMLHRLGVDRTLSEQESLALVGGPLEESISRLLPSPLVSLGTSIFRGHYSRIYLDLTRPMPGAGLILQGINQYGLHQGVITNKLGTSARALVRHFGWDGMIPLCLGEGDGLPLKPDPSMILEASRTLGIPVDRFLFIGDSPFDHLAARQAGCRICLVATGTHGHGELAELDPDLLVESLEELWNWVREPDRGPYIRESWQGRGRCP